MIYLICIYPLNVQQIYFYAFLSQAMTRWSRVEPRVASCDRTTCGRVSAAELGFAHHRQHAVVVEVLRNVLGELPEAISRESSRRQGQRLRLVDERLHNLRVAVPLNSKRVSHVGGEDRFVFWGVLRGRKTAVPPCPKIQIHFG